MPFSKKENQILKENKKGNLFNLIINRLKWRERRCLK
jgi:hypothetical protein